MLFGYITLFVAFLLSTVAAYYSILGLTAIFASAFWPIVIMGSALEVAKVVTAIWLHRNWHRCGLLYKTYLVPSLLFLMLLTSMGTFGFLSRAHSDQSQVTGTAQDQLAVIDERIKTERENIDAAKRALIQMDQTVDQTIARSSSEEGATRAATLRRSQQRERQQLQRDIAYAQSNIAKLNEERAPIAAQYRKIEAEVGPIKYVAALIYGDNPSTDLLERSVRWVIILIVLVFDPLAVVLVLAGIRQLRWAKEDTAMAEPSTIIPTATVESNIIKFESAEANTTVVVNDKLSNTEPIAQTLEEDSFDITKYPYLFTQSNHQVPGSTGITPLVFSQEVQPQAILVIPEPAPTELVADDLDYKQVSDDYFEIKGKMLHRRVVKELYPTIYRQIEEQENSEPTSVKASFGTIFPKKPERGELFLQVSTLPSKLYKFNGTGWIVVDKNIADSYTYNTEYLKYLVDQMSKGILSPDDLTSREQEQVAEFLKNVR